MKRGRRATIVTVLTGVLIAAGLLAIRIRASVLLNTDISLANSYTWAWSRFSVA